MIIATNCRFILYAAAAGGVVRHGHNPAEPAARHPGVMGSANHNFRFAKLDDGLITVTDRLVRCALV